MPRVFAKSIKIISGTAALCTAMTVSTYLLTTRKTSIVTLPVSFTDPSPIFSKLNPRRNPVTADTATRRIALQELPIDLQDHIRNGNGSELTRRFCAGVWTGLGFRIQRRYLEWKYRHQPGRQDNLWDLSDLASDRYQVGTKIVDHFEVVESDAGRITVRCGDTPLNSELRNSDGLFRMETKYLSDSAEVELKLTSIFFNGTLEITDSNESLRNSGPMPKSLEALHRVYTKMWMESSVRNLCK